jgi:hypothetical protein
VVEGAVDDAVGVGGSAADAVEVYDVAVMDLGTGSAKEPRAFFAACEAEDLVACANEILNDQ